MPSPKRPAAEKIGAFAAIYRGLIAELPDDVLLGEEVVQAALLHAATQIALATKTEEIAGSILAGPQPFPERGLTSEAWRERGTDGPITVVGSGSSPQFLETLTSWIQRREGMAWEDIVADIGRLIHAAGGVITVPDSTAVKRFTVVLHSDYKDPLAPTLVWEAREI